jgi:hypothetical protein
MTDRILEEIKTATGWNQVAKEDSGYVITFHEREAHQIKGLSKNDTTFYLAFESLSAIPICFYIIRHGRHFQYWTLNDQLHRSDDKPAYIMYDQEGNRYHRRWYWHGLMHRTGGPAEESVQGYNPDHTTYNSHIKEEFKRMEMEWWSEGIRSNGGEGIPIWASADDGWRCKNKVTGLLDWPDEDWPAFFANCVKIEWENPGARMIDYFDKSSYSGELRPTRLVATNVSEKYLQGELTDRACEFFEMQWALGDKEIYHNTDKMVKFNDAIKTELLTGLNFWKGSLLSDAETDLILTSEFNRIYNSEKLD